MRAHSESERSFVRSRALSSVFFSAGVRRTCTRGGVVFMSQSVARVTPLCNHLDTTLTRSYL